MVVFVWFCSICICFVDPLPVCLLGLLDGFRSEMSSNFDHPRDISLWQRGSGMRVLCIWNITTFSRKGCGACVLSTRDIIKVVLLCVVGDMCGRCTHVSLNPTLIRMHHLAKTALQIAHFKWQRASIRAYAYTRCVAKAAHQPCKSRPSLRMKNAAQYAKHGLTCKCFAGLVDAASWRVPSSSMAS